MQYCKNMKALKPHEGFLRYSKRENRDLQLFITRCWVAAHMCVLSHFRTCDVRAEVRAERFLKLRVRCACMRLILGVRCAIALLHTFLKF